MCLRQVLRERGWDQPVVGLLQHEGGRLDRRQRVTDVDFLVQLHQPDRSAWAHPAAEHPRPPVEEGLVVGQARREEGHEHGPAPLAAHPLEHPVEVRAREADREVLRLEQARVGPKKDELVDAGRMASREQKRHRPTLRHAEDRRALQAGRLDHGIKVVHAQLERGRRDRDDRRARTGACRRCRTFVKLARRSKNRRRGGYSNETSRCETKPGTKTSSTGPSPMTR